MKSNIIKIAAVLASAVLVLAGCCNNSKGNKCCKEKECSECQAGCKDKCGDCDMGGCCNAAEACEGQCSDCKSPCGGCKEPCPGKCKDGCKEPCKGQCPGECKDACKGQCPGQCKEGCKEQCKGQCPGQCDKKCDKKCKEMKCKGKKCKGKKDQCCKGHEGMPPCHPQLFAKKLPVGVQLYSVRTDLEKDFYGTLKAIREMGYAGVEFYGEYYGNSVVQVKKWCTELGLIPFSNHVPFQQMIDNVDKVIEENTILGVQYIVFPYMDEASRPGVNFEQFKKTVAKLGEIGAKVSAAGFQLLYHNHDFEFVEIPEGGLGYDYIFAKNDKANLQNEIDVCWAEYSGNSAAGYLQKYAGCIPVVHLKNYKLEGTLSAAPYALIGISTDNSMKDATGSFEYRPLGMGQVDMVPVIQAAIDGGAQWLCVEQDEPCEGLNRLEGVAKSVEFLRFLDLM